MFSIQCGEWFVNVTIFAEYQILINPLNMYQWGA